MGNGSFHKIREAQRERGTSYRKSTGECKIKERKTLSRDGKSAGAAVQKKKRHPGGVEKSRGGDDGRGREQPKQFVA